MMAGQCEAAGFGVVPSGGCSDVVVIHSCAVTQPAEKEAFRLIRRLRRRVPPPFVVVTGCVTALHDAERFRREGADLVVAQADKERIAEAMRRLKVEGGKVEGKPPRPSGTPPQEGNQKATPYPLASTPLFFTTRGSVKVQDGCDFRCAYCIVPDTRGCAVSRPLAEILLDAEAVAKSHREIVLTGVNVATYCRPEATLVAMIRRVLALPEVGRLRLSSLEPGFAEKELADLMADEPRLCRMLHYPLQSGDDGVLNAMRRRYTVSAYCDALEYILSVVPAIGLGTDVITGFPGETEAAFENTRKTLERYPFSNIHVFPYSERPGTPAATFAGSVPVAVRRERAAVLSALAVEKRRAFARSWVGKSVEVLIERHGKDGTSKGWTSEYVEARLAGRLSIGELVTFTPISVEGETLAQSSSGRG